MIDTWKRRAKLLKKTFGKEPISETEAMKSTLVKYNERLNAINTVHQDSFSRLKDSLDTLVKRAGAKGIILTDHHSGETLEKPADSRILYIVSKETRDFIAHIKDMSVPPL